MPMKKSGRMLVNVVLRRTMQLSTKWIESGRADTRELNKDDLKEIKEINHLIDRIQGRINRENLIPQFTLFINFTVTFIRPNKQRKQKVTIAASSRRRAYKIVRAMYGKKTTIIHKLTTER